MGVVFWMDYWRDTGQNGIWRLLGIQCRDEMGMESGQVLIDKKWHMDAYVLLFSSPSPLEECDRG